MTAEPGNATYPRRVYPLSPRDLTEEQLAVVFAMTSRRPDAFDEIAKQVTEEKAADFHERWVLGYGHASVAEHAVIHMAVENISRLACDSLEDNRLASYTEKSSRYQVLPQGYYHVPAELKSHPDLKQVYISACENLFATYAKLVDSTLEYLGTIEPQREGESDAGYRLRLRRRVTDSCRALLPAATLTNVGVTMNARLMEHAITKLLSSNLAEERSLGEELKEKGRDIAPTLIRYAEKRDYLVAIREAQLLKSGGLAAEDAEECEVALVQYDEDAERKVVAGLLYQYSGMTYGQVLAQVQRMSEGELTELFDACMDGLGDHDSPPRAFEMVDYTFELTLDYGAYREFKRHRMQSYIPQPLTLDVGYVTPELVLDAGLGGQYTAAIDLAAEAFARVGEGFPEVAQYLATHAHRRRVLAKMNLRECYHLFKLRTQPQAHFSIREPMLRALELVSEVHPRLFRYIRLRS